jgi:hypothetical protein
MMKEENFGIYRFYTRNVEFQYVEQYHKCAWNDYLVTVVYVWIKNWDKNSIIF